MVRLNRILVPTDFSEFSQSALNLGCELADRFGAELHLLHSVEVTPILYGEAGYYAADTEEQLRDAAAAKLTELPGGEWGEKLSNVVRETRIGHPLTEICGYCKDNDIDLIVMGTHGRGAIAHMLLGSVAEKVVRKAPCPVLTVRNPQHEFAMP